MAVVTIEFPVKAEVHKDKATGFWIYSHKKYNISGYGKIRKEAKEMFFFCMNEALIFKPKSK